VQWQVSTDGGATFSNIAGATSTTLGFVATVGQNGNQYRAVFTNTAGGTTTTAATLTVTTVPGLLTFSGNTATGTGTATVTMTTASGGPACGFTSGTFVPVSSVPAAPPAGVLFPQGLVNFQIGNCATTGISVTLTLQFPQALPVGTVYWKYGPQVKGAAASWYVLPGTTVVGNQISFTLTDGQLGDDDWTLNGILSDPGGPAIAPAPPPTVAQVPVLDDWKLRLALALLMLAVAAAAMRRKKG